MRDLTIVNPADAEYVIERLLQIDAVLGAMVQHLEPEQVDPTAGRLARVARDQLGWLEADFEHAVNRPSA